MRKKILALLCATALVAVTLTACGKDAATDGSSQESQVESGTQAPDPTPTPDSDVEPSVHYTFDGEAEGYTAAGRIDDKGDNDGANFGIAPTDAEFLYAEGPVGQAIYLDGTYGLDLGFDATNTDTYTIAFWMNADRLSDYGPTLQIGYDIGKAAAAGNDVTWMNFTKSTWGAGGADIFPVVWSRNEASNSANGDECFPWMGAFDDAVHGKKEWVHVAVVCTGEVQTNSLGVTTVGAEYYLDGQLVYDSQENFTNNTYFEYTFDATLAPNIMQPGDKKFETYFGINYWDTIFKGFVDDFYVYPAALSSTQVADLYALGDGSVASVAPEGAAVVVDPVAQVVTTIDANAIATVGVPTCDVGYWSSFTDAYEIKDGGTTTLHFNNYSSGLQNYHNYILVFTNTATTAEAIPSADNYPGYVEYGVLRADSFGWAFPQEGGMPDSVVGSWGGDWAAFLSMMMDADVTLTFTRNGSDIAIAGVIVGADGVTYTYDVASTTNCAAGEPMYVILSGEGCYIELLSADVS
ncbi:MAG: LamG domain-containing protein [Lachnospiraceae bacterium]|jgi:hypothetical protein|nr:LamG domain-containing protein [Lachnospiraceae bacterium]